MRMLIGHRLRRAKEQVVVTLDKVNFDLYVRTNYISARSPHGIFQIH